MKRFVGQCDAANGGCDNVVKNFVCFGYTNESDCKSGIANNDYIYRIIGITKNGEMKLIKNKVLNNKTYQWFYDAQGVAFWNTSDLYRRLNGSEFFESLSGIWQRKIMYYSWPTVTSKTYTTPIFGIASDLCEEEREFETINAYIGLVIPEDFAYAFNGSESNCYYENDCSWNWLSLYKSGSGSYGDEFTMFFDYAEDGRVVSVWVLTEWGYYEGGGATSPLYARPVFYLAPDVVMSSNSGTGTSTDPYIIAK